MLISFFKTIKNAFFWIRIFKNLNSAIKYNVSTYIWTCCLWICYEISIFLQLPRDKESVLLAERTQSHWFNNYCYKVWLYMKYCLNMFVIVNNNYTLMIWVIKSCVDVRYLPLTRKCVHKKLLFDLKSATFW